MSSKNCIFTLPAIALFSIITCQVFADGTSQNEILPPPDIKEKSAERNYETRTIYESAFLPGVRLCEDDEVDYRGDFRRINCQDEELIESVSTRSNMFDPTTPSTFIDNYAVPNGNVLRIKFQRKLIAKDPK
jgi:hypothetical protein